MTLCNVYGPNEENADFFIDLIHNIESLPNDNRIVGGDFNLVLDLTVAKGEGGTIQTKGLKLL